VPELEDDGVEEGLLTELEVELEDCVGVDVVELTELEVELEDCVGVDVVELTVLELEVVSIELELLRKICQ
jgi:hypothetical protein